MVGLSGGDPAPLSGPTREDPIARAVSEGVGGPLGARARRHRWWTPVRVLLALAAVMFALGMVQKTSCATQSWANGESRYTHMCYSDLPYLYSGRGFAERAWPYSDDAVLRARYPQVMEYPVGISYWAYGTAVAAQVLAGGADLAARADLAPDQLFGDPSVEHETDLFVAVNAVGFAVLTLLAVWLLAGVDRRRPWDATWFAVSPALALTAVINWDLLAVVLVAAALWTWSRGRPVATGVLIGLGTATKLYPLFLLGGVLVIAVRERRWRDLALSSAAAAAAWLVANAPGYLTGPAEWKVFWSFNSERGPDLGSIWLVAQQMLDRGITAHTVNVLSWLFFAAWCLGVAAIGWRARRTPTLAQLGFLVVAGFLLINKVYSPQYVLWLLPLAVLARPRWRDQIIWQATELLYFAAVWWYLAGDLAPAGGGDAGFYQLAILVRMAGEIYLVVLVARDVLTARPDVVGPPPRARTPLAPPSPQLTTT